MPFFLALVFTFTIFLGFNPKVYAQDNPKSCNLPFLSYCHATSNCGFYIPFPFPFPIWSCPNPTPAPQRPIDILPVYSSPSTDIGTPPFIPTSTPIPTNQPIHLSIPTQIPISIIRPTLQPSTSGQNLTPTMTPTPASTTSRSFDTDPFTSTPTPLPTSGQATTTVLPSTTTQPPSKTVTRITITQNNQSDDLDLNGLSLSLNLNAAVGQAQTFNIPILVTYSDGTTRNLAYIINYNPGGGQASSSSISSSPTASPTGSSYDVAVGCSSLGEGTCNFISPDANICSSYLNGSDCSQLPCHSSTGGNLEGTITSCDASLIPVQPTIPPGTQILYPSDILSSISYEVAGFTSTAGYLNFQDSYGNYSADTVGYCSSTAPGTDCLSTWQKDQKYTYIGTNPGSDPTRYCNTELQVISSCIVRSSGNRACTAKGLNSVYVTTNPHTVPCQYFTPGVPGSPIQGGPGRINRLLQLQQQSQN